MTRTRPADRTEPAVTAATPAAELSAAEAAALSDTAGLVRVLVAGSLNVDYIIQSPSRPGDDGSVVVDAVTVTPGGHAGNCASALRRLGVAVTVAATVGRDEGGDRVLADLAARGIRTDLVGRADAPTGRVFIPLFPNERFMLMERGANDLPDEQVWGDVSGFDAVVVFDPPRRSLERAVGAARGAGRRTYWNPGGRYAGSSEFFDLVDRFDCVILNRDEYAQVFGTASAPVRGLTADQELVLTLGALGSSTLLQHRAHQPAPRVATVDETGAGDAFIAGYVLGDLCGLHTAATLRFANAVGALATRQIGPRSCHATLSQALHLCAGPSTTAPPDNERLRGT
jgi:ribokinase